MYVKLDQTTTHRSTKDMAGCRTGYHLWDQCCYYKWHFKIQANLTGQARHHLIDGNLPPAHVSHERFLSFLISKPLEQAFRAFVWWGEGVDREDNV